MSVGHVRPRAGTRPESGRRKDDQRLSQEVPSATNHHDCSPDELAPPAVPGTTDVDDVTRAVCVVDELPGLPELAAGIDAAVESRGMVESHPDLVNRVRELIEQTERTSSMGQGMMLTASSVRDIV